MVMIAVVTLSYHKLQEREGRWLKLTSGLVMLGLGVLLLIAPERLLKNKLVLAKRRPSNYPERTFGFE